MIFYEQNYRANKTYVVNKVLLIRLMSKNVFVGKYYLIRVNLSVRATHLCRIKIIRSVDHTINRL